MVLFPGFLSDLSEPGRLDGLTYGLLGSLIGHEISHAFDSEGISRNGDGIVGEQWRDDVTKKVFDRQVRRIEEHYGNLTLEGAFAKVNGTTTRNENMADITGELLAYRAYLRLREKVGGEEPGLQIPLQTGNRVQGPVLSARQLFWVSYASCYCSAYSPEMIDAELLLDRDDAHLPNYYRVTGSLMNLKEFAAAFSCPSGSYMNPTQKILVWGSGTNDVQGD
ncbi:hypothetical protein ONE63_001673 [Megalurothrips usitatus]|uniref:Peptidase M13 C-terminal domain-containing protein n=1 Tax=Megalurothrips usitatus TaxID=439358 RepID=A0AAV7X927_9NEOP|nr:hypothetical protein ONE63_001673 [Megalurothrips usitatus]